MRKKQIDKYILSKRFMIVPDEKFKVTHSKLDLESSLLIDVNQFVKEVNFDDYYIYSINSIIIEIDPIL